MINPYYIYIFAFGLVLIIYQFQWSELYPNLSIDTLSFLIITFAISFVFGKLFYKPTISKFHPIKYSDNDRKISYLILLGWGLEFVYNKGIPILLVIQGAEYEYQTFGIPSFHVFLQTFSSFWAVHIFQVYLSCQNRKTMLLFLLGLLPQILIFNRGGLLIIISSCLFVYLVYIIQNLNFLDFIAKFSRIFILAAIILFLFGVLGNIRTQHLYNRTDSENIILEIGKATEGFKESSIPIEFFWAYLYTSSPLANLQTTIEFVPSNQNKFEIGNISSFINNEIFPDFLSKRMNEIYSNTRANRVLIDPQLNVSTVYAGSYAQLSWLGMIFMAAFIFVFPLFYNSLLTKENPFSLTGIAILNSLYIFLIFENMFVFSGLSFQLIYPLVLQKILKK